MRKVEMFQSKDGKVFMLESECVQHEKILLFREWYEEHILYGFLSNIDSVEIIDWLQKHRLQVLELLNVKSNGKA